MKILLFWSKTFCLKDDLFLVCYLLQCIVLFRPEKFSNERPTSTGGCESYLPADVPLPPSDSDEFSDYEVDEVHQSKQKDEAEQSKNKFDVCNLNRRTSEPDDDDESSDDPKSSWKLHICLSAFHFHGFCCPWIASAQILVAYAYNIIMNWASALKGLVILFLQACLCLNRN